MYWNSWMWKVVPRGRDDVLHSIFSAQDSTWRLLGHIHDNCVDQISRSWLCQKQKFSFISSSLALKLQHLQTFIQSEFHLHDYYFFGNNRTEREWRALRKVEKRNKNEVWHWRVLMGRSVFQPHTILIFFETKVLKKFETNSFGNRQKITS